MSFVALQHSSDPKVLFFTSSKRGVLSALPCVLRRPTLGFGYPFDELASPLDPREPISAPHALGLRSLRFFSIEVIGRRFPFFPPPWRFASKPLRLRCCASAVFPPQQPFPYLPPGGLDPVGVVTFVSLGPLRLSLRLPNLKGLSPLRFPSRYFISSTLSSRDPFTLRVLPTSGPASPFSGRRPVWPFCRSSSRFL